tara:strand:+ start:321 stop:596 length:276 start_codon:yes stop_codon:yes gene_type:complete
VIENANSKHAKMLPQKLLVPTLSLKNHPNSHLSFCSGTAKSKEKFRISVILIKKVSNHEATMNESVNVLSPSVSQVFGALSRFKSQELQRY